MNIIKMEVKTAQAARVTVRQIPVTKSILCTDSEFTLRER